MQRSHSLGGRRDTFYVFCYGLKSKLITEEEDVRLVSSTEQRRLSGGNVAVVVVTVVFALRKRSRRIFVITDAGYKIN